jgi:hypothetical protein
MILEQEYIDERLAVSTFKHPFHNRNSVKKYVRSYKVNTDEGVSLQHSCKHCHGRGWQEFSVLSKEYKNVYLKNIQTCRCVDKVMEKLDGK